MTDLELYAISTTLGFRIAISRLDWALESMITDNEMRGCAEMLVRSAESVRHDRKNVGRRSVLHLVIELACTAMSACGHDKGSKAGARGSGGLMAPR
jgi:hypothetical protein